LQIALYHPEIPTCENCKKWEYTKEWKIRERGDPKKPQLRAPPFVTPCETCPKKSHERAAETELSEKNIRAVEYFYRVRATFGRCLAERAVNDGVLMRNLGIIERIVSQWERSQ